MANNFPADKKVLAVSMLCEGSSIRAIERVTAIHRDTFMRLGIRVGEACKRIMDEKLRNIPAAKVKWTKFGDSSAQNAAMPSALARSAMSGRSSPWTLTRS